MRKLLLCVLLLATVLNSFAQVTPKGSNNSRIFAPQQPTYQRHQATAQGGSFQIACKPSIIVDCYNAYFRTFKTKKLNKTDFLTEGLGGTVAATITGNATETTVELTVTNASFPNLVTNFRTFCQVELLRDTFSAQKRILESMVNRKARTEAENVWFERKIERLKTDIANAENKIQMNNVALVKYETMIEEQKGYVADIQAQIDELLATMPTK